MLVIEHVLKSYYLQSDMYEDLSQHTINKCIDISKVTTEIEEIESFWLIH